MKQPKSTKSESSRLRELFETIRRLESRQEIEDFFTDLCTPAELEALADRWQTVLLLDKQMSYREIYEQIGVSTTTVTRVARSLERGANGYRLMLQRTKTRGIK